MKSVYSDGAIINQLKKIQTVTQVANGKRWSGQLLIGVEAKPNNCSYMQQLAESPGS
jgi:hypothetical protein